MNQQEKESKLWDSIKADMERLAEAAGMSLSKFERRYERGQIKITPDGNLEVLSKKDLKGEDKEAESPAKSKSSKRKHDDDEEEQQPEKKQKKKKSKKE